ncbi:autophagy-related protein 18a [Histomonas meleagridis]|uniref:autophagy-related protein 18a n=1 Tax=Histomonas meleagridis TaxID=135588 RepID=UPI00355A13BF|nr:autophagy-related protein 18a [Histomonas meleagridis]KAH0798467.1 autophagy-related protein 18a [Histomonas meleagridis]
MNEFFRHIAFDQRIEQAGATTPHGFMIFECASSVVLYEAKFPDGGADQISLLSDSNVIAVSGDDTTGGFTSNTVILWDRTIDKVMRLFDVETRVLGLVLRADALVIIHGSTITFYNTCDFTRYCVVNNPTSSMNCFSLVQSVTANLVSYPSDDGSCINICDYHDPEYVLGTINVPPSRVVCVEFSRQGELLAIVVDEGKNILLYSLSPYIQLLATYHRGFRSTEITGITFDSLSNYFLLTSKRGTLHVFAVPPANQPPAPNITRKSSFTFEFPKNCEIHCQFDIAGYLIIGMTLSGVLKQMRLDIEKKAIVQVSEKQIDIS